MKMLILKGVPKEKRRLLWLITSGAKREMLNNPGYYSYQVKDYPTEVELPNDRQNELVFLI